MREDAEAGEPWDCWNERPELDADVAWIFTAWMLLHGSRAYTFDGTPRRILESEVGWWFDNRGVCDADKRLMMSICIGAIDSELLALHDELESERKNNQPKRPT